jgi:hypothetical protein
VADEKFVADERFNDAWSKRSGRRQTSVSLRSSHRLPTTVTVSMVMALAVNGAGAITNPTAATAATANTRTVIASAGRCLNPIVLAQWQRPALHNASVERMRFGPRQTTPGRSQSAPATNPWRQFDCYFRLDKGRCAGLAYMAMSRPKIRMLDISNSNDKLPPKS